ncbi:MAG: DUF4339 domain-containing protein [Planctomycetota bacterium]|nr:DUF4339 domain-containing protein [Planctomycetota bacterium]
MATQWFCRLMGEDLGPFSSRDMVELVRNRKLTQEDMIRKGSEGSWLPAYLVQGLFDAAGNSVQDPASAAARSASVKSNVHEKHADVPPPSGLSGLLSSILFGHRTKESSVPPNQRSAEVRNTADAAVKDARKPTVEVRHRQEPAEKGSPVSKDSSSLNRDGLASGSFTNGSNEDTGQSVRKWFCVSGGERRGPMTLDELKSIAALGRLKPHDRVWSTNCPRWSHANEIPDLIFP